MFRRTLIILAIGSLIALAVPQVTLGAWWNPFSWFNNWTFTDKKDEQIELLENRIKELEVEEKDSTIETEAVSEFESFDKVLPVTARMRECAAINCDPIKTYSKDTVVSVIGQNEAGDWYRVTAKESNGSLRLGWMAKSVFSVVEEKSEPILSVTEDTDGFLCNGMKWDISDCSPEKKVFCTSMGAQCINLAESTFCDGAYYSKYCPAGYYFYCPPTGKGQCLASQTTNTSDPFLELFKSMNQQYERDRQDIKDLQDELMRAQVAANARFLQCENQQDEIRKQLVEEWTAAGGFWTESQLEYRTIQRMKEQGHKDCYSGSGVYIGGFTTTQCHSLQGGYDCYSSNGARTQVIPNGNSFEIRSW